MPDPTDPPATTGASADAPDARRIASLNRLFGALTRVPEQRSVPVFVADAEALLRLIEGRDRLERDRANFLLRNAEFVLQLCWRDLNSWVQFGRYNAEGIIPGAGEGEKPGPLPDPPQRPTVQGTNYSDQNVTVIEEALTFIHKHLGNGGPDEPIPEPLLRRIGEWLTANQITEPHKYRWGLFPLGMVQRWVERAGEAEACLNNAQSAAILVKAKRDAERDTLQARITTLEAERLLLRTCDACGTRYDRASGGRCRCGAERVAALEAELAKAEAAVDGLDLREGHVRDNADPDQLRSMLLGAGLEIHEQTDRANWLSSRVSELTARLAALAAACQPFVAIEIPTAGLGAFTREQQATLWLATWSDIDSWPGLGALRVLCAERDAALALLADAHPPVPPPRATSSGTPLNSSAVASGGVAPATGEEF